MASRRRSMWQGKRAGSKEDASTRSFLLPAEQVELQESRITTRRLSACAVFAFDIGWERVAEELGWSKVEDETPLFLTKVNNRFLTTTTFQTPNRSLPPNVVRSLPPPLSPLLPSFSPHPEPRRQRCRTTIPTVHGLTTS